MAEQKPRCSATKTDGTPCMAPVIAGETTCYWHSPARKAERKLAQQLGAAKQNSNAVLRKLAEMPLASRADIVVLMEAAAHEVLDGKITCNQSNAVSKLARTALAALKGDNAGLGKNAHIDKPMPHVAGGKKRRRPLPMERLAIDAIARQRRAAVEQVRAARAAAIGGECGDDGEDDEPGADDVGGFQQGVA